MNHYRGHFSLKRNLLRKRPDERQMNAEFMLASRSACQGLRIRGITLHMNQMHQETKMALYGGNANDNLNSGWSSRRSMAATAMISPGPAATIHSFTAMAAKATTGCGRKATTPAPELYVRRQRK